MSKNVFSWTAIAIMFTASFAWAQNQTMSTPIKTKKNRSPSSVATTAVNSTTSTFKSKSESNASRLRNVSLSEAVLIPAPGQTGFSVRLQNSYRDYNYKIKVGGPAQKDFETRKGILIYSRFDHGTENGWAVGGEVGTSLGTMTESRNDMKDSDAKGLTDFVFTARKARETEKGQLFYGGQLGFSPGEREWANPYQTGNLYSGGHSLTGFVGIQNDFKTHIFGGQIRHDIFLDRSESIKGSDNRTMSATRSNGNIFGLDTFVEKSFQKTLVGASLGLDFVQASDYQFSLGSAKQNLSSDPYQVLKLSAYARLPLKEVANVEILPAWNYSKVLSSSGGSFSIEDSTEISNVSLSARWSL